MLTAHQMQLLDYIHSYTVSHGYSPSFIEMRDAMGLHSKSGIHRMLAALEERGFIRRLKNRARAIEVLKPSAGGALKPVSDEELLAECARRGLIKFATS